MLIDMHIWYISYQYHSRESGVFRTLRRAYIKFLYDYIQIDGITIQGCYLHCVETISRLLLAISPSHVVYYYQLWTHAHMYTYNIHYIYIFISWCNICKL